MRFAFTEDQLELRSLVRRALERECTPSDLRDIAEGRSDGRSAGRWALLAEMGATGLLAPEPAGGMGLCEVDLVGVLEEAGWAALPEPLAETAALAVPLLSEAGATQDLPPLARGELAAAVGGVERAAPAGTGLVTTTRPVASRPGTLVTERVAGAGRAGVHLLVREVRGSGWEVHSVRAHAASVTATPSIDATRDVGAVEWTPRPHTLIASGDHAAALVAALADRGAVSSAAQLLGLADRMITLAVDYARERRQFGQPVGSFQAVKHLLANARVRLEFARPATYRAADSLARGVPERSEHASMAKALASDAADQAARAALQVHGAIGYTWECDLHLYMKRAWALSAAWGDAATHRARVLAAAAAG